jgi:phosphoglycolate phosphatase-like HAD superfamily hydrolase
MSLDLPGILALDFDGVICDGLIEYFATTQRTYEQLWHQDRNLEELAQNFYKLRPVIETGWEMPVLLRSLVLGVSEAEIFSNWSAIADNIVRAEKLDRMTVSQKLDRVRDNWIQEDLAGWLSLHRFYPGIIDRLQQIINSPIQLYIVTTKEGRFVEQLLQQQAIELPAAQIIGKEVKRPKYETLRILKNEASSNNIIWFVEDRLSALQQVRQQADLQDVTVFLADWGYNIEVDRQRAQAEEGINLLSLDKFILDFDRWKND